MKAAIKIHWPAIVAATLITAFIVCAVLTVINLTESGLIHWNY